MKKVIGLLIVTSFVFFGLLGFASADPPQACFDQLTGLSYLCGPGSKYNQASLVRVQGGSQEDILGSNGWSFPGGGSPNNCFSLEQDSTTGQFYWLNGQDCTASRFNNPLDQQIPGSLTSADTSSQCYNSSKCDLFASYINPFLSFLSAAVGIVIVIVIVLGGVQYSSARDNPQATAAAKKRITNALIAALAYLLLYGFLEFIIPGGFLNG